MRCAYSWVVPIFLALLAGFSTAIAQVPVITSVSPDSGRVGQSVTIAGTGFSTTASNNIVYFGVVRATVTSASSTSLVVTVPVGSSSEPVSVTVGGLTAYAAPFITTFASGRTIDSSSFAPAVSFSTGIWPLSMIAADFDSDGKPDIAIVNLDDKVVSLYHNTATPRVADQTMFAARTTVSTGSYPYALRAADVDGDGKLDLIVVNRTSKTLGVFRNTSSVGTISFASMVTTSIGGAGYSVAVGDLDGDGKPDFVVANYDSNTISVIRNTSTVGSISFGTTSTLSVVDRPRSVAIADLDSDGLFDVVVGQQGQTISVFRNVSTSGTISFDTRQDITGLSFIPVDLVCTDLNQDGKPDIASMGAQKYFYVFQNTSTTGSISFGSPVAFLRGDNASEPSGTMTFGDLDGDGKTDLVIASPIDSTITLARNRCSTPGMTIDNTFFKDSLTVRVRDTFSAVVVDVDGDSVADVVSSTALMSSSTINVHRNLLAQTHTVTVVQASHGAISPSGSQTVYQSESLTFTATPDTHYKLDSIMVDGAKVSTTSPYTLSSISANHTVTAAFSGGYVRVALKAILEGAYTATGDSMTNLLRTGGVLASHFSTIAIPALAVDSVNIELRDAATAASSTIRRYMPAWLMTNGTLRRFTDTSSAYVQFDTLTAGSYYLVVRHRNHLAIMSAAAVALDTSATPTVYNFTTAQTQAYGTNPMKAVGSGSVAPYALLAGDANSSQSITILDRAQWRAENSYSGYLGSDMNLSGSVTILDRTLWRANNSLLSQVP